VPTFRWNSNVAERFAAKLPLQKINSHSGLNSAKGRSLAINRPNDKLPSLRTGRIHAKPSPLYNSHKWVEKVS
jgi:hypothetical protein